MNWRSEGESVLFRIFETLWFLIAAPLQSHAYVNLFIELVQVLGYYVIVPIYLFNGSSVWNPNDILCAPLPCGLMAMPYRVPVR